ncbi:protein NO VEIN domain-containing protein [Streptomyces sp. NPDC088910]|uniref:protein NO VEIN domain-containing protein n=1 Tax=Streptomyces sp. NPDC088910 TaxID=3365911 RepID=UPI003801B844
MKVRATQVSLISDAYGYDVEALLGMHLRRYEVKAGGPHTQHSFHLSRNEFDTGQLWPDSWRIIQVVFTAAAFTADEIRNEHVQHIRELDATAVRQAVVEDSATFTWDQSSIVTPAADSWKPSILALDSEFATAGFHITGSASP